MMTLFVADIGGTKSELAIFPLSGSVGNSLSCKSGILMPCISGIDGYRAGFSCRV